MRHEVEHFDGHTIVYDEGPTNWGAYVEDLPVCFTVADTREECGEQIRAAIAVYLDALARDKHERPWLYQDQTPAARIG